MSLSLWEYFWDAVGDVWGATESTTSPTDSGGGGHLNPRNDDIFPRPDESFWDAREAYLRSRFPQRKKPTYTTPDTPITPSIVRRPLSRQAYARPVAPEPFKFTPPPDTAQQGMQNMQASIAQLQALKAHVNAITAKLQNAKAQPVVTPKPKIPLTAKEKKLRAAKKAAAIMLRAIQRAHGMPLQ